MPLDPIIARILAELPPLEFGEGMASVREAHARSLDAMGRDHVPGVTTQDVVIPGPDGPITARVYRPDGVEAPAPTMVYLHGGSWIVGSVDLYDPVTRRLAVSAQSIVVSVDYRLAPEHPFPAGLDDSRAALDWVIENVADLGGDRDAIVLAGDSAGGNFTAALALDARERDVRFAAQFMFYPSSDLSKRYPSMDEYATGYLLETPPVDFPDRAYLVDPDLRFDTRTSPILADSFADLPPAVIYTAEFDPIKDHGTVLADAYRAAGVDVILRESPGMIHGFILIGHSPEALAEVDRACADLREILARRGDASRAS